MPNKIKPQELHPLIDRTSWDDFWISLWHGKPPIEVGNKPETGWVNAVTRRKVTTRINQILKKANSIKIGVTGDVSVRMDAKDYRQEFTYVELVYLSSSEKMIKDYEVELIKKFQKADPQKVVNISTNKAGRLITYDGYFRIYVVFNTLEST